MQPTRRYWEFVGVGVLLVISAILFAQPLLLVGAAGVFGWLLTMQVAFVHALTRLDRSLVIEQSLSQAATQIDEPITATLSAAGETKGIDVTVSAQLPAGVEVDGTDTVSIGDTTAFSLKSPIAGLHTLGAPAVSITDSHGLFSEQLARGPTCELTVQPRTPTRVHIGEGGDAIPIAFGEHPVDVGNSGLVPAELREYTGDESLSRIDWKATARLAIPHVREFEAESDIPTILVLDRRGRVNVGPTGETAFEYLRSGALSYLTVVQSLNDPAGCLTVGETHIEKLADPINTPHGYASIRRRLDTVRIERSMTRQRRSLSLSQRSPMLDRETSFGRTLASYTAAVTTTQNTSPLPIAIRQASQGQQGMIRLAVFTDDSDHAELRATVSEAKRQNVHLSLFIAPHVLYDSASGKSDSTVDTRYEEFETFRRQLASIDGVTAYEVTPRERIERVLETMNVN